MRILLTGATGRFGQAFSRLASSRHTVQAAGRAGPILMDLESPGSCAAAVERAKPDWIVHAGGMTDVDACERDPARARLVNGEAAGALAAAAKPVGARVLFLSTDYVFDGKKGDYHEADLPNPISAYGRSKLEGERVVLASDARNLVARSSVVFGTPGRPDFVAWVRDRILAGEPLRVVSDQRASPTSTADLAAQCVALLEVDAQGIFHAAGADALSRLEMANIIAGLLKKKTPIEAVHMTDMAWVARRPRDSSLNVQKVGALARPMRFKDAAATYLAALGA